MAVVTLSVSNELKARMGRYPEINWAELSRQYIFKRLDRGMLLRVADEILKDSKMTDEDVKRFSDELKERVARRHGLM